MIASLLGHIKTLQFFLTISIHSMPSRGFRNHDYTPALCSVLPRNSLTVVNQLFTEICHALLSFAILYIYPFSLYILGLFYPLCCICHLDILTSHVPWNEFLVYPSTVILIISSMMSHQKHAVDVAAGSH